MSKKEEEKIYHVVIKDTIGLSDSIATSTIKSTLAATGSLAQYDQYYNELKETVNRAAQAGSMNPSDDSVINNTLDEWRGLSENYYSKIIDFSKQNEPVELDSIKKEIDMRIPDQQKMIQEIYEKIVGNEIFDKLTCLFNVKTCSKEETDYLKKIPHASIVKWVLQWIETKDKKLFGDIIHGLNEAGIDIILQVSFGTKPKLGIQVKNDGDIKDKQFALKLKAQITDSKRHQIEGLIIFLAGDMTNPSVDYNVTKIISELSQMNDSSLAVISPEKAMTIIKEINQ